ncbi:MAG: nucleotidyl transferase AbiEii/AbiGii toxin family protein [Candidatus Moranbacteria bacterium]|nr:nucleotidyl transferase AbiEii/AbiGii toxin family protein [Candidatus Moranbacteria bacterium]
MAQEVKTTLAPDQKNILDIVSQDKDICRNFYLTGGTALAEFYLKHRFSEDLDFFAEQEFNPQSISVFFKKNQAKIGIKKIDYQSSFNRNLFFLHLKNREIIKTEFTYFPFPRIEKKIKRKCLFIDSLMDIATNKIFTIYQKPRSRDFIDLYLIIERTGWEMEDLIKKAKIKFDWHIDYLELGSKFLLAKKVKDYPKMLIKLPLSVWQNFFIKEANKFKKKVLE